MDSKVKVLICRSDHLGDLLLSLPAIQSLRDSLPNAELAVLARSQNLAVIKGFLKEQRIRALSLEEKWEKEDWDVFLSLFSNLEIAIKCWNRIPLRVGQYSKWWSFLLFNHGRRQKRSLASQSEGMYSFELVQELLKNINGQPAKEPSPVLLPPDEARAEQASRVLEQIGLNSNSNFIVIHPGMAGSALNLTARQYQEVITRISSKANCIVSVGPSEQDQIIWDHLNHSIPGLKKIEGLELSVLKEIFRKSRAVIAPSTGPLHLAHLVGAPVIGLYSPVLAHHPKRWSPWGGIHKSRVLAPQVDCPGKRTCLGNSCREFSCMEKIDWASLILKELGG